MAIQGFFTGDVKIRDLNGVLKAVDGIVEVATDAGTVTSVGLAVGSTGTDVNVANSPITSSGNITLNLPTASATNRGLLSSADWSTFNSKQNALGYTPANAATTLTINGTTYDLSANRSWSVGTHTGTLTANFVPKATGSTTLTDSLIYDNGSGIGINTTSPYDSSNFKLDVNGGLLIKNTSGTLAQLILINSNPATGGNNGFVQFTAGGNTATAFAELQSYYGLSIASGALRLQPSGGQVLIGTSTTSVFKVDINGTLRVSGQLTLGSTITNGTYTYTLPGATGTLALTSQIPSLTGYVPYTGATGAVNLGAFDLTVQTLTIGKGNSSLANNTALGYRTLFHITTGNYNTAVGYESSHNITTGQYNTTLGQSALFTNTTGSQNTAIGLNALLYNTSGGSNVVVGLDAMQHNTTGSSNTALGYNAGTHITGGSTPNTTASSSVYIGRDTKAKVDGGANEIVIGYNAVGNGSNTSTFGNTSTTANYFTGSINGGSFVKIGGTSSQFLKADGSVDSSTYYLASNPSAFIALTALSATAPLSYSNTTGVFSISQATTSTDGYLSSTDWNTFYNKQTAGSYITALTGEATASGPGSATVTLSTSAVTGKLLTGLNLTGGGSIAATDSILQAFGKVQNQISGMVGGVIFQGTWDASTNTPTLTSSVGTKGYYYIVSVAGSTNLNGITDWKIGDWAIFNGTTWDKVDNTDAVSSVNGFTGAVSLTTSNIAEGTNLYYLDSRARLALSFTAGSGAYDNTTGVITIPTNTSQLTNGANFITLSSLSASSPLAYNSGTGAFSIQVATGAQNGYLSSTDWTTFNSKQNALTLTTTGSSGSSTLVGATLNVPTYTLSGLGGVPTSRTLTINGTALDLSADRSWSVGTHTGTLTSGFIPKATGATTLTDSLAYDGGSSIGINTSAPHDPTQFKLDVNGGLIVKNASGTTAQFIIINANPATGGNNAFVQHTVGGTDTSSWAQIQTYYGLAVAAGALRLQPNTGQILVGTTTASAFKVDISGTLRVSGQLTLGSTITDGTNTYTLPSSTGTLALVGGSGVGTVTSVAALTIGTTGTDLSSTVANSTTTPVITLNVPTASATNRGALSSADWTTFNNKQPQLNGTGFVKASGTTISYDNSTYLTTSSASSLYLPLAGGTLTGALGGTSASFTSSVTAYGNAATTSAINSYNTLGGSGTAQHYQDFGNGAGFVAGRILRGNGASGLEANGLNIDNHTGFKVRLNQLGGSGGSFTIDGGNLGLGVTPSAWGSAFKVFETSSGSIWNVPSTDIGFGFNAYNNGTNWIYKTSTFATDYYQNNSGSHVWRIAPSGTAGNAISFTQAMTLDASGNLLLGTTSNTYSSRLAVIGSGNGFLELGQATSSTLFQSNGQDFYLNLKGTGNIVFRNGSGDTERMRLDASGQLLIGLTLNTGGGRVEVLSNGVSAITTRSSTSGTGQTVKSIRAVNSVADQFANSQYDALSHAWILSNSTQAMTLDASGNLMLGGTTQLGKATIIGNNNDANSGQLVIAGSTSTNKRTSIGYNTTGDYGFISVYTALSGYNPLALQPNGGNVGIGTTTPGEKLEVNGNIKTAAPTNGTAQPWKLGEAVSGSTSTNYYIKVEINGQIYSIPALQGTP
jgi:predicted heme/steroid binding protein